MDLKHGPLFVGASQWCYTGLRAHTRGPEDLLCIGVVVLVRALLHHSVLRQGFLQGLLGPCRPAHTPKTSEQAATPSPGSSKKPSMKECALYHKQTHDMEVSKNRGPCYISSYQDTVIKDPQFMEAAICCKEHSSK